MTSGSVTLLGLLIGTASLPAADPTAYSRAARPFASVTLLVNPATRSVTILSERNVAITLGSTDYPDMQMSNAFAVTCILPNIYGQYTVNAWADSRYNLLPVDIVEYKIYDPSYIKLEINTAYFTDRIDDWSSDHKVQVDFFQTHE